MIPTISDIELRSFNVNAQVWTVPPQGCWKPKMHGSAHRHLKIMKELHADRTFSSISELSAAERVHEVARMLGGQDLTETTLAHAREMVERGRGDSGIAREVELTS